MSKFYLLIGWLGVLVKATPLGLAVLLLALVVLALAGCSTVDRALDESGEAMVDQVVEYCGQPVYRRDAWRVLVNGRLAAAGDYRVTVRCPDE